MEVTDDNTERLMPLEEEFCFLEFPRGGDVPLKNTEGSTRLGLEAGGARGKRGWDPMFYSTAGRCSVGASSNGQEAKHRC